MDKSKDHGKIEGEGSYSATADYNRRTADYLKKGHVESDARAAERALDSKEATALHAAEARGKAGDPKGQGKAKTG